MKKIMSLFVVCVMAISLTACGGGSVDKVSKQDKEITVQIDVENYGVITAELYPDIAPVTVANFVKLASSGFYDGLVFHRVVPAFVIQGGGEDANGAQKQADAIKGEFASNGFKNTLKHARGVLSMARTTDPNSASSQFFICVDDTSAKQLDGNYATFGKVTNGMDIVDKIIALKTFPGTERPEQAPVIKSIKVAN